MKKFVSAALTLLMVFSAISAGIGGIIASADPSADSNFLLSHPDTGNLNDQTSNPYSQPKGQNFSLSTMNELYYYASYDNKYYSRLFDEMPTGANKSGDYYWMKHINMHNSNGFDSAPSSGDNYLSTYRLSYVQAVGFDPLGRGKKDHIAFIGYSNYKSGSNWLNYTYIVVQDLREGSRQMYAYELDRSSWARDRDLPYYLGSAYFAIDAGDFDGDGKDTLVAYCPSDTNSVRVSEITFNGSGFSCSTLKKIEDLRSDTADLLTGRESSWEFKPTVSFAVGDFDADGVDNLAISTGFGNPASYGGNSTTNGLTKDSISVKKFVTNVSIMEYNKTAHTWSIASQDYMYNRGALISSDNDSSTYHYDVMHMGAITAGDIDNNGYDDIVAVGFRSYTDYNNNAHCRVKEWKNSSRTDVYSLGDIDKTQYAYSVISYDSANKVYQRTALGKISMNNFEAHNFKDDSNSMWPQIQIAAGYTNGRSNPAEVFINGEIFTGKSGELITQYKPQIFTQTFNTLMDGGTSADMSFTAQVAAGNFDNNNAGREQFAYTVAFKENDARDYAMYLGYVGGCTFDDDIQGGTVVDYGQIINYGNSDIRDKRDSGSASGNKVHNTDKENASQIMYNNGDHWTDDSGKCLNGVICAVDWDSDGLIGRFSKHGYITSDPTPVAVLQVSPYFDSLMKAGAYGSEQSEAGTTYTIGYSFEKTTSKGNNVSFGVGVTGEIELKHVKMSAEIGYSLDWNETFEKSVAKEYSKEFTVNEDSVLVTIVPVDIYSYDVYNPTTGRYISDGYTVRTPSSPVYQVMSIDEYNAAVTEYNAYIDSSNAPLEKKANKLKTIQYGTAISDDVQLPANSEGNPYVYQTWTSQNLNKMEILSDGINMGYAGATVSAGYNYSTGTTHSTEMAHGFNFSFTIMFGGEAGDVGLWGGGYVNLDYSQSKGNSVSIGNSEGCSGEVVDPKSNEQVPPGELNKYGFQWKLAQWTSKLVVGTNDITPVVGYAISGVKSPVGPPKNLEAVYNLNDENAANSSITLTWEKPDPIPYGPGVKGYYIYDDGEMINSQVFIPSDSSNISYTINSVEYGSKHHFTVKAVTQDTDALSTPSNEAVLGWVSDAVGIDSITKDDTYVSADGLTDKYVIKYSNESETVFYVRNGKDGADGQNGTDGQNGKDAFDVAVENGFTGTYEDWLAVSGAKCAADGHNYTEYSLPASCGVKGITLKVCSDCGFAVAEETDALSHDYRILQTVEPTCTAGGYTVYKCENCRDIRFDDLTPAKGHTYIGTAVAPTHDTCGYTRYVCEDCGDSYCDDLTPITPHTFTEKVIEPTCTQDGYTELTCSECDLVVRKDTVPAKGHSYSSSVTAPTCAHSGYTVYKCTACGDEYISDIVPPTEHNFKNKVVTNTCTAGGFTIKYCADCGYSSIIDETEAKGHDFEVTETVEPTCTAKGYSVYTCKNCGISYNSDEVACKSHSFTDKVIAPDCAHTGYTIHTCSDCGFALIDSETPASAHTPGEWICEDPATGKYVRRCENCYKLLDTKTVSLISGNGGEGGESGEGGNGNNINPNIDENGVLNIGYGKTEQLRMYSDGIEASQVVYSTSDPKVVTVDSEGNVTAVGPGEATVTASVPGTGVSASVPVKVNLTWWQRVHYVLNSGMIFRLLFMLFGIKVPYEI